MSSLSSLLITRLRMVAMTVKIGSHDYQVKLCSYDQVKMGNDYQVKMGSYDQIEIGSYDQVKFGSHDQEEWQL